MSNVHMPESFIFLMITCPLYGIIAALHLNGFFDKIILYCDDQAKGRELYRKMMFQPLPSQRKESLQKLEAMCSNKELFNNLLKWRRIYQGIAIILFIWMLLLT